MEQLIAWLAAVGARQQHERRRMSSCPPMPSPYRPRPQQRRGGVRARAAGRGGAAAAAGKCGRGGGAAAVGGASGGFAATGGRVGGQRGDGGRRRQGALAVGRHAALFLLPAFGPPSHPLMPVDVLAGSARPGQCDPCADQTLRSEKQLCFSVFWARRLFGALHVRACGRRAAGTCRTQMGPPGGLRAPAEATLVVPRHPPDS